MYVEMAIVGNVNVLVKGVVVDPSISTKKLFMNGMFLELNNANR